MIIVSSLEAPTWLEEVTWVHESAAFEIAESAKILWLVEPTRLEFISIARRRDRLGLQTFYSGSNELFLELLEEKPAPTSMVDLQDFRSESLRIIEPDIDPLTDIILGSYSDEEKELLIETFLEKYPDSRDAAVVLSELNPSRLDEMLLKFPTEPRLKILKQNLS